MIYTNGMKKIAVLLFAALFCASSAHAASARPLAIYEPKHCLAEKPDDPNEEPQCIDQPTDEEVGFTAIVHGVSPHSTLCPLTKSIWQRYTQIMQSKHVSIMAWEEWSIGHADILRRARSGPDPAGAIKLLCDELHRVADE